jgi:hypothetical protein
MDKNMKSAARSEYLTKFEKIELKTLYNGKETGMRCANGSKPLSSMYTSSPHYEEGYKRLFLEL